MSTYPRILIAVDKFKGSLTGAELSQSIAMGMKRVLGDEFEPIICPIADGGDGTVEAAVAAGYQQVEATVAGPFSEPVNAHFAFDESTSTAVIEVAEACGLWRINSAALDTWNATSYGVGELILAALDLGATHIVVGLGGSATTDAGAGMLQALGVKILDKTGGILSRGGGALLQVGSVDFSERDSRLSSVELTVACDVVNPLLGSKGAATVFGPQKGATEDQIPLLDQGIERFSNLLELSLGVSRETLSKQDGAGAAGGLGFACLALGGRMRPGIELCFELTGFDQALSQTDVVVTGEGKLDTQTLEGKGPAGVARATRAQGKRTFAICGENQLPQNQSEAAGFEKVFAVLDQDVTVEESLANPRPYVEKLGEELAGYLISTADK